MHHGYGFFAILILTYIRYPVAYGLHDGSETASNFSDEWLVHFDANSNAESRAILATTLGYKMIGEIPGFKDYVLMKKLDHDVSKRNQGDLHTRRLKQETTIKWAKQVHELKRVTRSPFSSLGQFNNKDLEELFHVQNPGRLESLERDDSDDGAFDRGLEEVRFNDDEWQRGEEWYLRGYTGESRRSGEGAGLDLNVVPVYKMGITGKGVKVSVIDDGLEFTHDDIKHNYDPEISHDYSTSDLAGRPEPSPDSYTRSHGTRCAGEIAMEANNKKCGVGISYNARIGGIKMLGGRITDSSEAQALQHAHKKVDVINASWGPTDDGKTVEGPGRMSAEAMERSIKEGRDGKGVVYVWASGNGGRAGDNCNCDGYVSSIYTLSIGSLSQHGLVPWYTEPCAGTMAATFSSGSFGERKVATIDTNNGCTNAHTGTSASAPLGAGIVALVLEANSNLTWRDVQHLTVRTARNDHLTKIDGWKTNKAGLRYHPHVGFGLMDAARMVSVAKEMKSLAGPQIIEEYKPNERMNVNQDIGNVKQPFEITVDVTNSKIRSLEHVEMVSTLTPFYRGCLDLRLISPSGTISQVLTMRHNDLSTEGFSKWAFMSVHFWGENPNGKWRFQIRNMCTRGSKDAFIGDHTLKIYGTEEEPSIVEVTKSYLIQPSKDNLLKRTEQSEVVRSLRRSTSTKHIKNLRGNEDWTDLVGETVYIRSDNPLYE